MEKKTKLFTAGITLFSQPVSEHFRSIMFILCFLSNSIMGSIWYRFNIVVQLSSPQMLMVSDISCIWTGLKVVMSDCSTNLVQTQLERLNSLRCLTNFYKMDKR